MIEDASQLAPPPQDRPTRPPSSALPVGSMLPPGSALQRLLDQGAAKRNVAEISTNKKVSPSAPAPAPIPSFATQVFPQLPYLRTQGSSCIELAFYSEKTRAERQADFHRRLCARLEEVESKQKKHRRWLKTRAKAGLSPCSDHSPRAQYFYADHSPLAPSRIEVLDDEVDGDEDHGLLPQSAEMTEQVGEIELQ